MLPLVFKELGLSFFFLLLKNEPVIVFQDLFSPYLMGDPFL